MKDLIITFVLVTLGVFAFTAIAERILIPILRARKAGQKILDIGPGWHKSKEGTPTMGGIGFILPIVLVVFFFFIKVGIQGDAPDYIPLALTIAYAVANGAIGFVDDYCKLIKKQNEGLTRIQKTVLQFAITAGYLCVMGYTGNLPSEIIIPLINLPIRGAVWYIFAGLMAFVVVNGANFTDGIDGLASGLGLIALGVLFFSFYELHITIYTIFTAALMGTIIVFMYFNLFGSVARNRKTFMGDTGSLILGYALAFLAFKYAMYNPHVLPYRADALLLAYTILIVPTFDLIRVALARLKNGVSIFHADKTHIHHKFMAIGFSMRTTLYLILGLQIGFCIANSVMYKLGVSSTIIVAVDVLAFCGLHFYLNQRIKKN